MADTKGKAVKFILFDVDGLLLDTEIVYTRVTQEIVGRFGKTFDWSIKANMIGRGQKESSQYLVDALDLPITPEEYLEERNEKLRDGFVACDAMPGAEKLVRHLHGSGIPIAVATSSSEELFNLKKTRHTDWMDLFDAFVSSSSPEVNHAKPAPDIFLTAADKLGANADQTLIFEDAPSGLEAGIAANMRVIVVPDPNMDKTRYTGHDAMLESLEDFIPEDYGLPPYR